MPASSRAVRPRPRRTRSRGSFEAAPLSAELRGLTLSLLCERARALPPGEGWSLIRRLREEAVPFYTADAAEARRIADLALGAAHQLSDARALGWAQRLQAEALLYSGRMLESESAYARAASSFREAEDLHVLGQLLVGRIHVLTLLGRHDAVQRNAREARRLLESAADAAYLARLAVSLGNAHFQRDEYEAALEEYERAVANFAELEVRDEVVYSLELNRASALTMAGREDEGLGLLQTLERETGARGYDLLQAEVRMNLSQVHAQRGEFARALSIGAQVTDYFRRTRHPVFLATSLLSRAEVYHQLNLHRDAALLAAEAADLFRRQRLRYDAGLAHCQRALSDLADGRPRVALRELTRGRRLFASEHNPSRVAYTRLIHAEALWQAGRMAQAANEARTIMRAFRTLRLPRWEAAASVLLARIELHTGRPAQRPRTARRLRNLAKRLSPRYYPLQSYRVLETLGEVLERQGGTEEAEHVYREAVRRLEDLRTSIPTEDSKVAFLGDKMHLFDRLIQLELNRPAPSPRVLFEWMERSRAQALWDRMRQRAEPDAGDRVVPDGVTSLRRKLSRLHAEVSRLELGTDEERARCDRLRRRLPKVESELARALRDRGERLDTARVPGVSEASLPDANWRALPASLPQDWAFVAFHIASSFAFALVVDRAGSRTVRFDSDAGAQLELLADRLDFQWGAASLASIHAPGGTAMRALRKTTDGILAALYRLIWEKVDAALGPAVRGCIVSPHGPLHRVPLHALLGPSGYVVDRLDLSIVPSARVWWDLGRHDGAHGATSNPTHRSAWVGGVPSSRLPAVRMEVARVAESLVGYNVTTDLAPTVASFTEGTSGASVVHLAAHGSLRPDNPAFSFLQLTDGPMLVADVSRLSLPGSTVMLSACSSGRGAAPAGDEWIGLARGFLQAGAASVVASLWPIQDEPTLELVHRFYGELAHESVPHALGRAMRAQKERHAHPWHWAPFALLGGVRPSLDG